MGEISQGVQSMEMMSYFSYFWLAVWQFRGLEGQEIEYILKMY